MNWSDLNLMPAMPEIVLLALLGVVLLVDLWICDKNRYLTHLMSLGTVIVVAVTQLAVWEQGSLLTFNGMYIADGMSRLAKLVLYALTFSLFIYSKPYNQDRQIFKGEFYTLSLFALLGMSVMVSSAHFLTAYIGLELLSFIVVRHDCPAPRFRPLCRGCTEILCIGRIGLRFVALWYFHGLRCHRFS